MAATREPAPPFPENLRLYSHLFVAFMVLTWVAGSVPYPYRFASLATAAIAIVFATLALWSSVGVERSGMLRVMMSAGALLAMLSLFAGLGSLLIIEELTELQTCQTRAITGTALEECDAQFKESVNERFPGFGLAMSPAVPGERAR